MLPCIPVLKNKTLEFSIFNSNKLYLTTIYFHSLHGFGPFATDAETSIRVFQSYRSYCYNGRRKYALNGSWDINFSSCS